MAAGPPIGRPRGVQAVTRSGAMVVFDRRGLRDAWMREICMAIHTSAVGLYRPRSLYSLVSEGVIISCRPLLVNVMACWMCRGPRLPDQRRARHCARVAKDLAPSQRPHRKYVWPYMFSVTARRLLPPHHSDSSRRPRERLSSLNPLPTENRVFDPVQR